jgi:two-component system cell cycle response regulator
MRNGTISVLVIEDEADIRQLLRTMLEREGFSVTEAMLGRDGVRLFHQKQPNLVILDVGMPDLDGWQVLERIRDMSDVPVLMLTALGTERDKVRGLNSGADDYLTKPFDSQELRARLHVGQRILDLQDKLIAAGEELLFRATHDNLTGICNRGVILDTIRRERSRQDRGGNAFAIVLADLDHFKYVNDTHGHLAGDAVLQEVARRMTNFIRPYDAVGRYGGEEFLIVVPSSDAMGALGLSERIRHGIEATPILADGVSISVTGSFGIAASTPGHLLDPQEMIRLADDALYRAKKNGRNRCELAAQQDLTTHRSPEVDPVTPDFAAKLRTL